MRYTDSAQRIIYWQLLNCPQGTFPNRFVSIVTEICPFYSAILLIYSNYLWDKIRPPFKERWFTLAWEILPMNCTKRDPLLLICNLKVTLNYIILNLKTFIYWLECHLKCQETFTFVFARVFFSVKGAYIRLEDNIKYISIKIINWYQGYRYNYECIY